MAGVVLTGNMCPSEFLLKVIKTMPFPRVVGGRGQLSSGFAGS